MTAKPIGSTSRSVDPDRFRELREVGRGAQGRVLLVQHIESGEKFVLKQIPITERSAEKESAAFSEVDVLSRLSHPNITTLYGAWAAESMLNILMEYADRGSLADVLKSKHGSTTLFDEDAILDWFVQIVSALRAMHARSILHRDLKAANVFLTSRNLIKVGDFGISKMLEKNDGLASTTIGTPYYLAPEVINGEPYGLKADVWSLGVLLYEMMALRKPFEATSLPSLALKIVSNSYAPPPPVFSPELRGILSSLLQREPTSRPSLDQLARHPLLRRHEARLTAQLRSLAAQAMPSDLAAAAPSGAPGYSGGGPGDETPRSPLSDERRRINALSPPADVNAGSPPDPSSARKVVDRLQSGSKVARQDACGLRMRLLADGRPPRHAQPAPDENGASPTAAPGALRSSLEDNLRFAQNLQALEFNLAAWESGDPIRAEVKVARKKGAMMPTLSLPLGSPPLRESNAQQR